MNSRLILRVFVLTMALFGFTVVATATLAGQQLAGEQGQAQRLTAELFEGLDLRGIGPTLLPGRIRNIAVDPRNRSVWYVAVASGNLWKTTNRGLTWRPIFENFGSYSMGYVALDPHDPDVVWLGTGESRSQRSVGFGDGIYRSPDGGSTWQHMGLSHSNHIAKIQVDPRSSDVVWAASKGPLWSPGGDRGLFKTTDGGRSWRAALQISENTGVSDFAMDPRNPDVVYASSYQRRRHTGMLIGGGPESAIFKTEDGGNSWRQIMNGIPRVDRGRIALAVSPQNPDVVYALVTAAQNQSGFFRSADRGETWVRQSDYAVVDPQYYGEIYADPHRFDRVWAVDVNIHVTEDGGRSFAAQRFGIHVDNHAIVFDPDDENYLMVGNDGGLYETYDAGRTWRHFNNMPTMQFYRVGVDNAVPFYNVYAGSQDNGTVGGPSRTVNRIGIRTSEWYSVGGGDGFKPAVDPLDPNIVYNQSQNGALSRLDLRTSARRGIRPQAQGVRWNWDSPLLISPHSPTRLYYAGSRLFRSDNRGDTWQAVSPDLTRQIDRDTLPVMGRIWGPDAVTRHRFTTPLGVANALSESPLREGLIVVGTDDGLIQVTEDGGENWHRIDSFPGVPALATVSSVQASHHDPNTIYASFHYYQYGDYRPYLLKSTDLGRSWTSIAGDLPDRHFVWAVLEDRVNPNLLFAGTEFGLFFTIDGGRRWVQLRGGVPTISFRDLVVQEREVDLVAATFGRGVYVLDDYSPLRYLQPERLQAEAALFPLRQAYLYHEATYVRAAGNYTKPNPAYGAVFTYYLRDALPRAGDSGIVLVVTDEAGRTLREINGSGNPGFHRIAWDLREQSPGTSGAGSPVQPGNYRVTLTRRADGRLTPLDEPQLFQVVPLPAAPVLRAGDGR